MNSSQVRVVDPILSTQARGYRQAGMIGRALFPVAPVHTYGGRVLTFGKESFRLYQTKRQPGTATKRIKFGYEGAPYAIVPSALEAPVPREWMRDASQVPGIDLASRAISLVQNVMQLAHEYECAQIALNPANYDNDHKLALAAGARWKGGDVDPTTHIEAAKEAVRSTIGIRPNTVMLSSAAYSAAKVHPKVLERIKYTNASSVTLEQLKALWEVQNIVVGEALVATGADDSFGEVWGPDAWVGYVSQNPNANVEEPSFGYTYQIEGHPSVEVPYWDESAKSWIYGVSDDNAPVLSGMTAGYLIKGAGLAAA